MGSRIAILVGLVAIVAFAVWAAIPRRVDASVQAEVAAAAARAPVTPDAPAAAQPVRTPRLSPALVDAAVQSCVDAQRSVAANRRVRGGPAPAGQPSDAAVVSRACAPLYQNAACRDALMNFDRPPPQARASTVFSVCSRAYCNLLPSPRPSACDHPPTEPSQMAMAWGELRDAILRHDLGPEVAARVAGALR